MTMGTAALSAEHDTVGDAPFGSTLSVVVTR
jgi:hypothetical protein